ncbi:hypothetical protein SLE2022_091570 [Rubroshorea leprosula]
MITKKNGIIQALVIPSILLFFSFLPSASPKPSIINSIINNIFPQWTVSLKNDVSHGPVYFTCAFEGSDKTVQRLEAGQTMSWTVREILFPMRWCYVDINNNLRGAFWVFRVTLKCFNCSWSIRNDGVYYFNELERRWEKQLLFSPNDLQ